MSKESRKFRVPDALADLYDFANTLDVRHFTHHGVMHEQGDELKGPRELGAWLARRGLGSGTRITPAKFVAAIELRTAIRNYLKIDPAQRYGNRDSLNAAIKTFPLAVEMRAKDGAGLKPVRADALAGLSEIVAQLYDGARDGTLGRLKMCASDECRRVFFDRSKPATRRWCMSTLCGNRIKTRNYRERQRRNPSASR